MLKVEFGPTGGSDLWGAQNPPTAVGIHFFRVFTPGRGDEILSQKLIGGISVGVFYIKDQFWGGFNRNLVTFLEILGIPRVYHSYFGGIFSFLKNSGGFSKSFFTRSMLVGGGLAESWWPGAPTNPTHPLV